MAPLAAIVTVGIVARVAYLGEPQLSRDEAASWYLASQPLGTLLRLSTHETFPPLYLLLLKAWMAIFGDAEAAIRSLSVAAGVGTILISWRWARDSVGGSGAAVVGLLVALSPALVLDSRNARMYGLETFFAVGGWWLVWRLVAHGAGLARGRRLVLAAALVLFVAGEVWSMSLGIPAAALQLAFAAIAAVWLRSRVAVLAGGCVLLGAITVAPWLPNLLSVAANGQSFWTATPDGRSIAETVGGWLIGGAGGWPVGAILVAGAVLTCGLAMSGFAILWQGLPGRPAAGGGEPGSTPGGLGRDRLLPLAIVLAVGLVPVLWTYSQVRSIYDPRYLGSAFPPFAIAVAASLAFVARRVDLPRHRIGPTTRRLLALLAILTIVSPVAIGAAGAVERWRSQTERDPAREMAQTLSGLVGPGDVVLTLNAQSYFPLRYYLVRSGDAGRLGVRLFDWHRPSAAFFTGWQDIEDAEILDASRIEALGWEGAAHLAPGGSLWLVSLVDPGYEFPLFAPLQTGAVREIRRIDVGSSAQVREAIPAGAPGQRLANATGLSIRRAVLGSPAEAEAAEDVAHDRQEEAAPTHLDEHDEDDQEPRQTQEEAWDEP
jgi:4-amino-4-deoxy-L-arabinose transferase-like glycosyltransferase